MTVSSGAGVGAFVVVAGFVLVATTLVATMLVATVLTLAGDHQPAIQPMKKNKTANASTPPKSIIELGLAVFTTRGPRSTDDANVAFVARLFRKLLREPLRKLLREPLPLLELLRDPLRDPLLDPLRDPLLELLREPLLELLREPLLDPLRDLFLSGLATTAIFTRGLLARTGRGLNLPFCGPIL